MYADLKEMLYAWVVSRSDEGLTYCPGAAKIAAMLLLNLPAQQAFVVMRNLLERHLMRSFFGGERAKDDVSFQNLLNMSFSTFFYRWKLITGREAFLLKSRYP